MNLSALPGILMVGCPGFLLGMWLPGRLLSWGMLVYVQVAPGNIKTLPIKPAH